MISPMERLARIRTAWEQQKLSIPDLSSGLEEIFSELRWDINEEAAQKAFEAWGDIEIITATLFDENRPPTPKEKRDAGRFANEFFITFRNQASEKMNYLNKIMRLS